jgi:hypothetical protein
LFMPVTNEQFALLLLRFKRYELLANPVAVLKPIASSGANSWISWVYDPGRAKPCEPTPFYIPIENAHSEEEPPSVVGLVDGLITGTAAAQISAAVLVSRWCVAWILRA